MGGLCASVLQYTPSCVFNPLMETSLFKLPRAEQELCGRLITDLVADDPQGHNAPRLDHVRVEFGQTTFVFGGTAPPSRRLADRWYDCHRITFRAYRDLSAYTEGGEEQLSFANHLAVSVPHTFARYLTRLQWGWVLLYLAVIGAVLYWCSGSVVSRWPTLGGDLPEARYGTDTLMAGPPDPTVLAALEGGYPG